MAEVLTEEYQISPPVQQPEPALTPVVINRFKSLMNEVLGTPGGVGSSAATAAEELQRYIGEPTVNEEPLGWWKVCLSS